MLSRKGMSLPEILVLLLILALTGLAASSFLTRTLAGSTDFQARANAQSELEELASLIKTDFERHARVPDAVELTGNGEAFLPPCSGLTLRQRTLTDAARLRRIEVRTECSGVPFPDENTRSAIHSELGPSCALGPQVILSVQEEGSAVRRVHRFPSQRQRAAAICFRASSPNEITAELRLSYRSGNREWRTLKKNLTLSIGELGENIEVVAP